MQVQKYTLSHYHRNASHYHHVYVGRDNADGDRDRCTSSDGQRYTHTHIARGALIGANSKGIVKVLEIHFDLIYGHNVMFHTHTHC